MTILSAQSLRSMKPVTPFLEAGVVFGLSYGLGPASYDVRIAEALEIPPGGFALASTLERFQMSYNVAASVKDKSSWARRGLAVQNTFIDPGWEGYLTLELSNHHPPLRHTYSRDDRTIIIPAGCPIAQIVFEWLDEPTVLPYRGKYQNQQEGSQEARDDTRSET